MSSLGKRIKQLENNIAARKMLTHIEYQHAKHAAKNKLSSPVTLGVAFLSGFFLLKHRKNKTNINSSLLTSVKKSTDMPKMSLINKLLYIVSEISGALTFANYIKNLIVHKNKKL